MRISVSLQLVFIVFQSEVKKISHALEYFYKNDMKLMLFCFLLHPKKSGSFDGIIRLNVPRLWFLVVSIYIRYISLLLQGTFLVISHFETPFFLSRMAVFNKNSHFLSLKKEEKKVVDLRLHLKQFLLQVVFIASSNLEWNDPLNRKVYATNKLVQNFLRKETINENNIRFR